ncbi:MAG: RluA family pseudouridine synthase [Fibrobacter sp.]|nr:RluA family pseudouridine synthase [Fibrobacter sp.]
MSSRYDIVYEDDVILVVNKESGFSAIPGRGDAKADSLLQALESQFERKFFVVHRIDRDTSGLIIFAKTPAAHKHLNIQFEKRLVKKTYLALVMGVPLVDQTIDAPIYEFGSGRMGVDTRGKNAMTEITVLNRFKSTALLMVKPITGRRHQIRVHLYSIGHPIMGDKTYGSSRPVGGVERLMLHAHTIEFTHPDKSRVQLEAPLSEQWRDIVQYVNEKS